MCVLIGCECWYRHMTQVIRFQCRLGAGMYFGRPHHCWQSQSCVFEFKVIMVWARWTWTEWLSIDLIACFCQGNCISQYTRVELGVCQLSLSCTLMEFVDSQSKYCNSWSVAARVQCFCGLTVCVWSLFSENELPQQAGGVSSPSVLCLNLRGEYWVIQKHD